MDVNTVGLFVSVCSLSTLCPFSSHVSVDVARFILGAASVKVWTKRTNVRGTRMVRKYGKLKSKCIRARVWIRKIFTSKRFRKIKKEENYM